MVDFPGHMAAVFFVSGCNFNCRFCHNPSLLRRCQAGLSWQDLEKACARLVQEWAKAAVISGGEPTLADDLPELINFFKSLSWKVKLDTNGSRPGVLAECMPLVDYIAMDVKAGPSAYQRLTGFSDMDRITESITLLKEGDTDYELRTTVIESFHDDGQLLAIADMIRGARRYVLQPFVPREDMPDPEFRVFKRTSPDRLQQARELMEGCAAEIVVRGD